MICPSGHSDACKFGTFKHINGVSQRYRCRVCGVVFSEGKLGMNRLPNAKREVLEAALRGGLSHRKAALVAGVALETARRNAHRIGVLPKPPRKSPRQRYAYIKQYLKTQPVIHERRQMRNDLVRATVALLLARNVKPMTKKQIFSAMLPEFPWLKPHSITNMLRWNADRCFEEDGGLFTFEPSPFYSPLLGFKAGKQRGRYYQLMDAARAAWFQARGIRDEHVEDFIQDLKQRNEELIWHRKIENWNKQLRKFRKP